MLLVSEALQSFRGEARMMEVRQNREGRNFETCAWFQYLCLVPVSQLASQYGCLMQISAKICPTKGFMDHAFPSIGYVVIAMRKVTKY